MGGFLGGVADAVGSVVKAVGGGFAGGGFLGNIATGLISSLVLGAAANALQKKPKASTNASLAQTAQDRTVTLRQAVPSWKPVYGWTVVGGHYVEMIETADKQKLHCVIEVAPHRIAAFRGLYLGNEWVPLDGSGNATGRYAGHLKAKFYPGYLDAEADPAMIAAIPGWTSSDRGRDKALAWLELTWSADLFGHGELQPRFDVLGRLFYDPRRPAVAISSVTPGDPGEEGEPDDPATIETEEAHGFAVHDRVFVVGHVGGDPGLAGEYEVATVPTDTTLTLLDWWSGEPVTVESAGAGGTLSKMVWSQNETLGRADYMTWPLCGLGAPYARRIDSANQIETTNLADEEAAVAEKGDAFTYDPATGICTRTDVTALWGYGATVALSTTGTLPTGWFVDVDLYVVPITTTTFRLATSYENARAQVWSTPANAGSGTHTATHKAERRYNLCGSWDTADTPRGLIEDFNTASLGITAYDGGRWRFFGAAWRAPTRAPLTERDLRAGSQRVQGLVGGRETFTAVKGLHVSFYKEWSATGFPAAESAEALAQDGAVAHKYKSIEFPFQPVPAPCHRLATIALKQGRREQSAYVRCKLTAYDVTVADTVAFDRPRYDWDGAETFFEVREAVLAIEADRKGAPLLGCDFMLRATAAADYDYDPDDAGDPIAAPPPTSNSLVPDAPTNLTATPNPFGIAASVTLTWTASLNAHVKEYKPEWRLAGDSEWHVLPWRAGLEAVLDDLSVGSYFFRVKSRTHLLVESDYTTIGPIAVAVADVMPRVSGLEMRGNGANADEFTGRDAKFVWREASQTGSHELGEEPQGGDDGQRDLYFKDFEVRVLDPAGALVRVEHTLDPFFDYTFEKNAEDFAARTGAPGAYRAFAIEVYQRGNQNQLSDMPARLTVSNPAPASPTGLTIEGSFRYIFVGYTPPVDLDWVGLLIWRDDETGFTPSDDTLVYAGPDTQIQLDAAASTQYFLRLAAFDAFGRTGLVISPEYTVTTGAVGTTELADFAVTNAKLGLASVDRANIAVAAVGSAEIDLLVVNSGHVAELSADKFSSGTISVETTLSVGANTVTIDGGENAIVVTDEQTVPVERVRIGKLGDGDEDYGIEVRNAAGGLIVSTNGLGLDVVGTANIAAEVVENSHIKNADIDGAKLKAATIDGANIKLATIDGANVKAATIDGANIKTLTVDTINVKDNAVTVGASASTVSQGSNLTTSWVSVQSAAFTSEGRANFVAGSVSTVYVSGTGTANVQARLVQGANVLAISDKKAVGSSSGEVSFSMFGMRSPGAGAVTYSLEMQVSSVGGNPLFAPVNRNVFALENLK